MSRDGLYKRFQRRNQLSHVVIILVEVKEKEKKKIKYESMLSFSKRI